MCVCVCVCMYVCVCLYVYVCMCVCVSVCMYVSDCFVSVSVCQSVCVSVCLVVCCLLYVPSLCTALARKRTSSFPVCLYTTPYQCAEGDTLCVAHCLTGHKSHKTGGGGGAEVECFSLTHKVDSLSSPFCTYSSSFVLRAWDLRFSLIRGTSLTQARPAYFWCLLEFQHLVKIEVFGISLAILN